MAILAAYVDLAIFKAALSVSDTVDDTRLLGILEDVSRYIDQHCQRHFYVLTATRTFTASRSDYLSVPYDLLSITTLQTDEDEDWDYDNTWAAGASGDYHLYPFNEWPKWKILVRSGGDYSFPAQVEGVQIAGLWGYGDGESATPYGASVTTTAEELDASETGVDVTSATNIQAGHTILVESEQLYVESKSSNTLTVVRGVNGTTAATHATAKSVYVYRYPRNIRRACLLLASETYALESAPFGVRGTADMGTIEVVANNSPKFLWWTNPYRYLGVG